MKETHKSKKDRMSKVIERLSQLYPDIKIQLDFSNEFELLIATMLSAQCTDKQVNIVTKSLFQKYKTPNDYLESRQEELEKDIYSTGFYKAKAKNIREMCNSLIEKHNSNVPKTMDELTSLAGVGRKTANVVLSHAFNIPGVVVDTHVSRISNKLGVVDTLNAVKIEFELMKLIPKNKWVTFTHYFINHGRNTCIARRPKCNECLINNLCKSAFVKE
ncbi:MAG: endonuclease III [Candidatus Kapabacteria bacterium]|nr:endonuclease III [Candidatus Kapabacteria bacterium]